MPVAELFRKFLKLLDAFSLPIVSIIVIDMLSERNKFLDTKLAKFGLSKQSIRILELLVIAIIVINSLFSSRSSNSKKSENPSAESSILSKEDSEIIDDILFGIADFKTLGDILDEDRAMQIRRKYFEVVSNKSLKNLPSLLKNKNNSFDSRSSLGFLYSPVYYSDQIIINSTKYPLLLSKKMVANLPDNESSIKLVELAGGIQALATRNQNSSAIPELQTIKVTSELVISDEILCKVIESGGQHLNDICMKQLYINLPNSSRPSANDFNFKAPLVISELFMLLDLDLTKLMQGLKCITVSNYNLTDSQGSFKISCTIPEIRCIFPTPDDLHYISNKVLVDLFKNNFDFKNTSELELHIAKLICSIVLLCELSILISMK
ncbi:MAG: hypothetical protein MHMPM18_001450 [Marteilia pararefringens]